MTYDGPESDRAKFGRVVLPSYPYTSVGDNPRIIEGMTEPRAAGVGAPPYRSRRALEGQTLAMGRDVIGWGSQARHHVWRIDSPAPGRIDIVDQGAAFCSEVINGMRSINDLTNYRPFSTDSKVLITWTDGNNTYKGTPHKFTGVYNLDFDGSGEYFVTGSPVVEIEHGSWEEDPTKGKKLLPQFRCQRYLAYRDVNLASDVKNPAGLVGAMRPGPSGKPPHEGGYHSPTSPGGNPSAAQSAEYEPFNFYEAPYYDVSPGGVNPYPPHLSNWLPADNYDDAIPDLAALVMAANADDVLPGGRDQSFFLRGLPDDVGDAIPWANFVLMMTGGDVNKCDVLIHAVITRWVVVTPRVITLSGGYKVIRSWSETDSGILGLSGTMWFIF